MFRMVSFQMHSKDALKAHLVTDSFVRAARISSDISSPRVRSIMQTSLPSTEYPNRRSRLLIRSPFQKMAEMIPCRPCLYSDSFASLVFGMNHLHFGKSQCRILLESLMNHFQIVTMPNIHRMMQMPKSDPLVAEPIRLIIVSLVIDFHHILLEEWMQRQFLPLYVFSIALVSVKEIVFIVCRGKVILCSGLVSKRFCHRGSSEGCSDRRRFYGYRWN